MTVGGYPGTCPPEAPRWYAARFSVPIENGYLYIRCDQLAGLRYIRIRGADGALIRRASVSHRSCLPGTGTPVAMFADPIGCPGSPRSVYPSADDELDDSSDGAAVDWPIFGGNNDLEFIFEEVPDGARAHFVLTFSVHAILTPSPYGSSFVGPCYTSPQWPHMQFRRERDTAWSTATVVDYRTRNGEPDDSHG